MESSRVLRVQNGATADALMTQEVQRALAPFMDEEKTVNQAALEANIKPNTMYVKVKRLLELGLVRVVREQPRKGRSLKLYSAAVERFFVPYEVMSHATREALQMRMDRLWERKLRRSIVRARLGAVEGWGYEVYRDDSGALWVHPATGPGERLSSSQPSHPATINLWSEALLLDFEDAKAFQAKLYTLFDEYKAKRGSQPYLFRLGLAPVQKE